MKTFSVFNIEYSLDEGDEDIDLPDTLSITIPDDIDVEDYVNYISDEISNRTGFCHTGFVSEIL